MTSPDLNEQFRAAIEVGPFGGFKTGNRAEQPALHEWDYYPRLSAAGRGITQEVWSGSRTVAVFRDGGGLHYLRHAPTGLPDVHGKRYGFAARTIPDGAPVAAAPRPPAPAPAPAPVAATVTSAPALARPASRGGMWLGATLALAVAAFAGGFATARLQPGWAVPGPESPAIPDDLARRTEEAVGRRQKVLKEFNDTTAELEAANARDAAVLKGRNPRGLGPNILR
jgi:hypothetical protein